MAGQKVWAAAESLLRLTEETLAHDVLLRVGLTVDEIETQRWFEFEPSALFVRVDEIVASLSPDEVWGLLQPQGEELRDQLCQAAANAIGSCS